MRKDTIKERLYQILLDHKKPMKHKELVEAYILKYPNYAKNYTQTKTPPEKKISGTIQSVLEQNTQHPRIGIDKSCFPYTYYLK